MDCISGWTREMLTLSSTASASCKGKVKGKVKGKGKVKVKGAARSPFAELLLQSSARPEPLALPEVWFELETHLPWMIPQFAHSSIRTSGCWWRYLSNVIVILFFFFFPSKDAVEILLTEMNYYLFSKTEDGSTISYGAISLWIMLNAAVIVSHISPLHCNGKPCALGSELELRDKGKRKQICVSIVVHSSGSTQILHLCCLCKRRQKNQKSKEKKRTINGQYEQKPKIKQAFSTVFTVSNLFQ